MLHNPQVLSPHPKQQASDGPYWPFSSHPILDAHHHSDKKIGKKELAQIGGKRQNAEEPFYFKLSNSKSNIISRKIEAKPELANVENMKKILNHNYSEEISLKKQQKRAQQRKKIMQERDYLSHFEKHRDFQRRQINRLKSDYNKDLHDQIQKKHIAIEAIKTEQRRIDLNRKPRQNSLIHKAESFRNFYEEAYRYRDNVAKEYKEYMNKERKYEETRNKNELLNLFSDQKDYSRHKQFERQMKHNQTLSLKCILQKQMHDKSDAHAIPNEPNQANIKQSMYHPIINPIDYKMDLANKYVLKEIAPFKKFFL